jgi:hypothetical protein
VRVSLGHCAAVLLGALLLAWPAIYNGFPLLYPDSMTYLDGGRIVARALFLHRFSEYYGVRSLFYSLGILPWHWNVTPWPVVALQCLLVAWVVWLVVRSVTARRPAACYLVLVLPLSLLTGVGWYTGFIMPDILGPVLYLSIYLLVFAPDTLSRAEHVILSPIAVWAVTAHSTHLILAAGLCVLLALFALFDRRTLRRRVQGVGEAAAIVALAAAAQLAMNGYLYGKLSLNGERPPYLMARIIADGPGRLYLEKHCSQLQWAICAHVEELSGDADGFLWGSEAIYENAPDSEKDRMVKEEMTFVLATVRTYPREQLLRSAANFRDQLFAFGIYGFDSSPWILGQFDSVLPRARASYLRSRQAQDALPLDMLSDVQWWTVVVSLAMIAVLIPFLWRRHSPRLGGLSVVIAAAVVANAFVTGVLSVVDDRYGCRVIWLVPLLAGVFLLDWIGQRQSAKAPGKAGAAGESAAASG